MAYYYPGLPILITKVREDIRGDMVVTQYEIIPANGVELENDVADRVKSIRFTAIVKREDGE